METTEPINGNDLEAVAANLIMETPQNQQKQSAEPVEATDDDQPEVEEPDYEDVDDVEASSDDIDDDEGIEIDESDVGPELYTVKVDGETRQVTLDELKREYSGQKYIQKGMQENAELRKEYEELTQQTSRERQMLSQMMQQLQNEGIPPMPEYPSEELRNSDPLGYLEAEADYRRAVDARSRWEQQARAVMEQEQRYKQQENERFISEQAAKVAEWMPEFANPEKQAEIIQDIKIKSQKHYGLTDEQLNTVKTSDELRILRDALKYRELVENKAKSQQKVEGARPVVKSAAKRADEAGRASNAKKAKAAMKRTGSVDDVTNWLLS